MISPIFTAFSKALSQARDPAFRRVLLLGVGLTVTLLIAVYAGALWLLNTWIPAETTLPMFGEVTWVNDLLTGTSVILMLILSVFLMVPVASAFTGLFLEDIADAVETKHYPGLPPTNPAPWGDVIRDTLNFLGLLVFANIIALFLYLIFAPAAPLIFWSVNGLLLGREYFQMVAMRRIGREAAIAARKRHAATIWLAGTLMAMPLSIPILNLVIPILGVATFTHLFHALEPDPRAR